jgi:hypothetical protein
MAQLRWSRWQRKKGVAALLVLAPGKRWLMTSVVCSMGRRGTQDSGAATQGAEAVATTAAVSWRVVGVARDRQHGSTRGRWPWRSATRAAAAGPPRPVQRWSDNVVAVGPVRQRARVERPTRGDRVHRLGSPSQLLCTKFKARAKTILTRSKSNRLDQAQEGTLDYLKKPKPDTTT